MTVRIKNQKTCSRNPLWSSVLWITISQIVYSLNGKLPQNIFHTFDKQFISYCATRETSEQIHVLSLFWLFLWSFLTDIFLLTNMQHKYYTDKNHRKLWRQIREFLKWVYFRKNGLIICPIWQEIFSFLRTFGDKIVFFSWFLSV